MKFTSHHHALSVDGIAVVGVINTTPDSFFDSGKFNSKEEARKRARSMITDGAAMIDIGGESTGPNSKDVSVDEECARILPVVTAIRTDHPKIWISVDTWKAAVAREALANGADMINDVTAGRGDAEMFSIVAASKAPIVLMYAKDPSPRTTIANIPYDDLIGTIHHFLQERIAAARKAGVEQIIVDPGLGHFVSSDASASWEILDQLHRFADLAPVLVSPSRKSFLAGPSNLPAKERLQATIAANCLAAIRGASFIRTHDVRETNHALRYIASLRKSMRQ